MKRTVVVTVLLVLLASVATYAQTASVETLTNASIITMKKNYGFSDGLIKSKIKNSPSNFSTDMTSLKTLKDAGVSDDVIEVMVNKNNEPAAAPVAKTNAGTLSDDKQTYTTVGGQVLKVGQTIQLGSPANTVNNLFVDIVRSIADQPIENKQLVGDFANKKVVIKKFYSKNGNTYFFYKPDGQILVGGYLVSIEAAINAKEIVVQ
ncbi:MAG TPA: hypothetical protein VL576_01855 [Candidatus Paceibacterota bacterium]|jgi:hypothetical protein|nr:hypothetical protein [Candidatus Paceibacterota bacterium]